MEEDFFHFPGNMLPTKEEVVTFIFSRTSKMSQKSAIFEAASELHNIWQKADACPLSVTRVIVKCEKLLTTRSSFMIASSPSQIQNSTKKPLSDFTRKRRLPNTSREPSKRRKCQPSALEPKIQEFPVDFEDVESVVSDLINLVSHDMVKQPCLLLHRHQPLQTPQPQQHPHPEASHRVLQNKPSLRSCPNPEKLWVKESGKKIFDIFSVDAKLKGEREGMAFDEDFLEDQRGPRKKVMEISRVTDEFLISQEEKAVKEHRKKCYRESAFGSLNSVHEDSPNLTDSTDNSDTFVDFEVQAGSISDSQYFSAIRTRSSKNQEISSAIDCPTKASVGTQVEDDCPFPTVGTRISSKRNGISNRLNPRILACGSLMMGVAGVTTRQALICIKLAGNYIFHQNFILPPSLERDYKKKIKQRRKLAKLEAMEQSSLVSEQLLQTRKEVADIVTTEIETDDVNPDGIGDSPESVSADASDVLDLIEVEYRAISQKGKRELLNRMLCKPSTLREAHHLMSTLGEQQQAFEMVENHHVNFIPDGTARQGGWGKLAGAVLKVGEKYRALRLQTIGSETHSSWVETVAHMVQRLATASRLDVAKIWESIMVFVSDMCNVNMNLAADVAQLLGCSWKPGQAFCNLHPRLMMSRCIIEVWKKHQSKIGHDKIFQSLEYCDLDESGDSLMKQILGGMMLFF